MNSIRTPAGVALCLAAFISSGTVQAAPDKRPNFVFFLVDDLRYDAMSCAGHPFVKTPHIDKLAAGGVRFTNAFVTLSLCAPSRATFMTGAYGHMNGVRTNEAQEFDPQAYPTFPMLLQKAGYETGFVGKWHMKPVSNPRPGFDYWLSFRGQGVYENPELNENGRTFQAQGYMTDLLTEHALKFLDKPREKPFMLCVWHKAVHGPFTPAPRHENLYADASMPEPVSHRDTFENKPAWQHRQPEPWNPRLPNRINYYRTEAAVDDSVGRVLAALEKSGRLDNTYVIFTSDNGFFHGEHRRSDKRAAYEESIRIPFVMRGPGIAKTPRLIDQMVLNIDFAPTLLDLAGVKPTPTMQGRSFKPLLLGESPPWRTSFLYEYFQEKQINRIPTMVGVRTLNWKYITYPTLNDVDELYDLTKDPHEMRNLIADPAASEKLAELKAEFARLKKETGYQDPTGGHP